jgi:hypothetical protein
MSEFTIEDDLNVKSLEIAFINDAGLGGATLYTYDEAIPNIIGAEYTVGDDYIDITLVQVLMSKYTQYAYSIDGGSSWVNVEVSVSTSCSCTYNFRITGLEYLGSYTVYVKALNRESYYHQVLVGTNITLFEDIEKKTIDIIDVKKTTNNVEIKFTSSSTDTLPTMNVAYTLKNGSIIVKDYTLSLNGNGDVLATEII